VLFTSFSENGLYDVNAMQISIIITYLLYANIVSFYIIAYWSVICCSNAWGITGQPVLGGSKYRKLALQVGGVSKIETIKYAGRLLVVI
jgi:hypothetical protein